MKQTRPMCSCRKALERVVFFRCRVVLVGVAKSRPSFGLDAEVDVATVMAYPGWVWKCQT